MAASNRPALRGPRTMPALAPTGPGAFIAYPSMLGGYEAAIDKAADLGLKWLAPRGGDRGRDGNWSSAKAVRAIAKAKSRGIGIYPWVYSRPDAVTAEIEMYRQFILEGASGIIIDAEDAWKSGTNLDLQRQKKALATKFMEDLRRVLPDAFIAHCPYAYPLFHWDFPYAEFGVGCDMVMPQLYWSEFNDAGFAKHWAQVNAQWKTWNDKNPNAVRPICHIGNTYGRELKGVLHPPPGEMRLTCFEDFVHQATAVQSCVPIYSLEAAKPDILDFMLRAWGTPPEPVVQADPFRNVDPQYRPDRAWAEALPTSFEEGSVGREVFLQSLSSEEPVIIPPHIAAKWGVHTFEQRDIELTAWDRKPFFVRETCAVECHAII